MLSQKEIEIIERYVKGLSGPAEEEFVEKLFAKGQDETRLREHLEKDWDAQLIASDPYEAKLGHLLDRVHHIIRNREFKKRSEYTYRFSQIYRKAAAILLLPLLAGSLVAGYLISRPTVEIPVTTAIIAPLGSRVTFNLPDGTRGWLNSGSKISYAMPFNKNRTIALEGEAWLDVAHDTKNPFEISAGKSRIKVLGTSFNVNAYQDAKYVEVVLQNGKVEFSSESLSEKVILKPSERLVFQDNKVILSETDPAKYKSWTDGKLVFRGDNMTEVARRIERWYNVKVILADQELESFSFRATFEDDSLEEILRLLSLTSPIRYKITPRHPKSDGQFEKEVITLYKKSNKKI
jgi:transmembrane sensor